jgi:hypothetical protein
MPATKRKPLDVRSVLKESVVVVPNTLTESQHKDLIEYARNDSYKRFLPVGQSCSFIFS